MGAEHDIYAAYLANFESALARTAHKTANDLERKRLGDLDRNQPRAGISRLLEWTINVYWPDIERKANMAAPRGRKPKTASQAENLLQALTFIEAGRGKEHHWQAFVRLAGNMAISFNGQISAGHPIAEELTLCPHLDKLEAGLKRCGKSLVISETPTGQVSIKGDKLRALVPCLKADDLPEVMPDPPVAEIGDNIKEALKVAGLLASEAAERVMDASVILEANTCTGTNGAAILQYWHGVNLPPHIVLPKTFVAHVVKQTKAITGFGFTWLDPANPIQVKTFTLWFEGGAWVKTQCYQDRWPIEIANTTLNVASHPSETLTGLFDAIEAVSDFTDDEWITFGENLVMSHNDTGQGATYEVKGLQGGKRFKGKLIKLVAPFAVSIDLTTYPDRAFFFNADKTVRGAIVGLSTNITIREPVGTIGGASIANDEAVCQICEGGGCDSCA